VIAAKWEVPCVGCPRPIEPGEQMERAGDGWVHVYCDPADKEVVQAWMREAAEAVLADEPAGQVA